MEYSWWGCRGSLNFFTLGSEADKLQISVALTSNPLLPCRKYLRDNERHHLARKVRLPLSSAEASLGREGAGAWERENQARGARREVGATSPFPSSPARPTFSLPAPHCLSIGERVRLLTTGHWPHTAESFVCVRLDCADCFCLHSFRRVATPWRLRSAAFRLKTPRSVTCEHLRVWLMFAGKEPRNETGKNITFGRNYFHTNAIYRFFYNDGLWQIETMLEKFPILPIFINFVLLFLPATREHYLISTSPLCPHLSFSHERTLGKFFSGCHVLPVPQAEAAALSQLVLDVYECYKTGQKYESFVKVCTPPRQS